MQKKQAALIAIAGGLVIFGIKLLAYFLSNSVALLSDALESIVNIAASGLMLFSVYISEKPADDSHNYGHQKIEEISSMVEGLLIFAAACMIIYAASGRLFESPELLGLNLAIGVSIIATVLNGGLAWFLSTVAKESGSAALEGDSKHLLSDVVSSAGVWVGLLIAQFTGWGFIDSLLAFAVSILVARMGIGLIMKSTSRLMDASNKEAEEKIREVLTRHKSQFIDFHYLKTRLHGGKIYADMHLTIDGNRSVEEAHDFTDHLQEELRKELPSMNLIIHLWSMVSKKPLMSASSTQHTLRLSMPTVTASRAL